MRHKRKEKKYAQERGFLDWGEVVVWRDFRPPHVSKAIWEVYIQYMMSEHFVQRSRFDAENHNKRTHGSITMYTDGTILFVSHAKQMVSFFLLHIIFLFVVENTRTNNSFFFFLQATILRRKPRLRNLFVETHVRNDDC